MKHSFNKKYKYKYSLRDSHIRWEKNYDTVTQFRLKPMPYSMANSAH